MKCLMLSEVCKKPVSAEQDFKAVFSGANGPLPSFIKLQNQRVYNVLTCYMKDCEVRFAKKSCFRWCLGRRHVRGVVRSMGPFSQHHEGSEPPTANERPHRTNPSTLQIGTHVTPSHKVQAFISCNTLLVYIGMLVWSWSCYLLLFGCARHDGQAKAQPNRTEARGGTYIVFETFLELLPVAVTDRVVQVHCKTVLHGESNTGQAFFHCVASPFHSFVTTPARHRPERQYNACANRRKQCKTARLRRECACLESAARANATIK